MRTLKKTILLLSNPYLKANMQTQVFFAELQRLLKRYPQVPPNIMQSENCIYVENIFQSKNLSFCFDCAACTDCYFVSDSYLTKNSIHCDYAVEPELCYDSVDIFKCFNSMYLEDCAFMRDSTYAAGCTNCNDVFGCVNLQNKSFCLFNRQLSETEYREKVAFYKQWPVQKILAVVEKLKRSYPLTQTHEAHNENASYGNYIYYSKNCYLCFDAAHNENCSYLYDSFYNKNCYDDTYAGNNNQLSYEIVDSTSLFNCNYVFSSHNAQDSSYLFSQFLRKNHFQTCHATGIVAPKLIFRFGLGS